MNHALYIAASGLKSRATALEVSANNLANIQTAGYKRDALYYSIFNRVKNVSSDPIERALADASVAERTQTDFSQGPLTQTGNPLDLALSGEGFFAVETPQGTRYTRNGNFSLNQNRELVTKSGFRVLGGQRPVVLPDGKVEISSSGEISVDGVQAGKLKIVDFSNLDRLEKEGNSLFRAPDNLRPTLPQQEADVRQGFLEQSNLNPVQGISQLISAMRSFEMLTRAIRTLSDSVDQRVIQEVGRV